MGMPGRMLAPTAGMLVAAALCANVILGSGSFAKSITMPWVSLVGLTMTLVAMLVCLVF